MLTYWEWLSCDANCYASVHGPPLAARIAQSNNVHTPTSGSVGPDVMHAIKPEKTSKLLMYPDFEIWDVNVIHFVTKAHLCTSSHNS
jgi:hypothetical protein